MKFRQLLAEEDAVSPVIGVILMVAITVILAAVIGTFVLGLGENVNSSAPQVNFQFEYSDTTGDGNADKVTITHTGGEDVEGSNVEVLADGSPVGAASGFPSTIQTGSTFESNGGAVTPGQTIRIVWTSPSGGNSQTIGQSEVPS